MMKRRTICNILTVAALLTALGTDYLASAGQVVRAEAVVNVAERMAARLTRAFARKVTVPAPRMERAAEASQAICMLDVRGIWRPKQADRCQLQTLYLPPPLA